MANFDFAIHILEEQIVKMRNEYFDNNTLKDYVAYYVEKMIELKEAIEILKRECRE